MEKAELLRKVKALADTGVDGEKANAEAMLEKLLKKYGVAESEIDSVVEREHEFVRSGKPFGGRLFDQCAYMVLGKRVNIYYYGKKRARNLTRYIKCTDAEAIEIAAAYEFYLYYLQRDLETLYAAFLSKNNIYPKAGDTIDGGKEYSDEERLRIGLLARNLERHDRHPAIERV